MEKKIKKMAVWLMVPILLFGVLPFSVFAEETDIAQTQSEGPELQSKAAVLMEASTGTVIYEKNASEQLSPASITKIMTLILIFDALEEGKITLQEEVTTSAYAKSMGGSQVFLEEGETQTVETLIKCIIVASGNDACVAMAEHLMGSEEEFVKCMNERALEIGMENSHFEDCCGLTDSDGHYTSAKDVAFMSRELITKYPDIFQYSGIWMENITHVTAKGSSEFGLANTNKLLKQYQWTTGLKTGSTSKAKYCVSATARKDDIDLIAVIMAAPDYKVRFSEAATLLDYGYAHCSLYKDSQPEALKKQPVLLGVKEKVSVGYEKEFSYLSTTGEDISGITKEIHRKEKLTAPIKKGDVIGTAEYLLHGTRVGSVNLVALESVKKLEYKDCLKKLIRALWI